MEQSGPYRIDGMPDRSFDCMSEAAQEAEFLHEERGCAQKVLDSDGNVVYTSEGAPD